ncbi:MAG: murein L,D-transpeptidase catalytic domain family protein [Thermoanaerobaculia bacterium]
MPTPAAPPTVDAAGLAAEPAELAAAAPDLAPEVLDLALATLACSSDPAIADAPTLAIIDYSLPSTDPRLWLFDRERGDLLLHSLVAHGVGTGENFATRFSNVEGTRASSLGLFRGGEVYRGRNGISLRLDGLQPGINDRARARTIVLHGAWYVSPDFVREHGRLGRSWGCPAVEPKYTSFVIDHLKEGGALFVHGDDRSWLAKERNDRCIRDRLSSFEAGLPPRPRPTDG